MSLNACLCPPLFCNQSVNRDPLCVAMITTVTDRRGRLSVAATKAPREGLLMGAEARLQLHLVAPLRLQQIFLPLPLCTSSPLPLCASSPLSLLAPLLSPL